ncbi:MAG TPA: Mpo1-like protein [Ramlibacter sp.]|nr:Mpo1-like protein [Ramlibacter sp.]
MDASQDKPRFRSFAEFYPYYLDEHRNRTTRRLHFVGTSIGTILLVLAVLNLDAWYLLAGLLVGYAFAWVGHFFFEKNKPATFQYPVWSFMGDYVMYKDIWTGKIPF